MLTLAQSSGWFIPAIILLYLTALIGYGAWHSRRIETQEDFAVAGRKLTAPVLVGTMLATWIGTGSLVGNAEKTYRSGIAMLIIPLGGALGLFVLSRIATRIRRFESLTVQDIIERRFGLAPRILATAAIISAYLIIVSYQYRAGGAVIQTIYPEFSQWCNANFSSLNSFLRANTAWADSSWGSVLAAAFIIGYTVLGGLVSVAYTDVINGLVMIAGILVGLPFLFAKAGGFDGIEEVFAGTDHTTLFGPIGWIAAINLMLPATLLVMGEANLYQRFFAARDTRTAGRAGALLVPTVLAVEMLIILLAFVASALEPNLPARQHGHVILRAAQDHMPMILGAAVLSAAVAIIVSTADSFLLVSSNSAVRDVYHRFINPNASQKTLVAVSRVVVVLLGVIAFMASLFSQEFLDVALLAYTIYGAAITPALLATFFWRRATSLGAAFGIGGGVAMTVLWKFQLQPWLTAKAEAAVNAAVATGVPPADAGGIWPTLANLDAVLPAMIVSITLLVGVSLLTPPPRREQWEPFAAVHA